LGLSAEQETDMLHAAGAPNGVILVVGPTGSGKTTTVTTVLSLDPNARFKRRVSLEIPPESEIPWLSQIPTSEALLDDHVKGILRSDPDEVSAGEARDQDTLGMAFDCAQTGHLTYVTFHANGVFPAFSRMLSDKFEADRGLLSMNNFVRGAFFQTLVGVLCSSCKKDAKTNLAPSKLNLLTKKFGLDSDKLFVSHRHKPGHGEPCSGCGGTGIVGRTAAIELVIPTRSMLDHIAAGDINAAELEYRKLRTARYDEPGTHGKTFVEHAIYKVSQGEVCADEVFGVEVLWNYALVPMQEQTARLHAV
jgi:general secretion pathway protein E